MAQWQSIIMISAALIMFTFVVIAWGRHNARMAKALASVKPIPIPEPLLTALVPEWKQGQATDGGGTIIKIDLPSDSDYATADMPEAEVKNRKGEVIGIVKYAKYCHSCEKWHIAIRLNSVVRHWDMQFYLPSGRIIKPGEQEEKPVEVKKTCKCDGKEYKLEKNYMTGKEIYELFGVNPDEKRVTISHSILGNMRLLYQDSYPYVISDGSEYFTSEHPKPKPVNVFFGGNLVELELNKMKGKDLYEALNCNPKKFKLWLDGKTYIEPNEDKVNIPERTQFYSSSRKIETK
ncbi:MAG TPA: hypothetical protein VHO03_16700 [Ignavibacteriales bacterium]|nr:hypothetical protein [Ignavibacteriales bacterium]